MILVSSMNAQGTYQGISSVKLSSKQIQQLQVVLKQNNPNDTIYGIEVSKCILASFHEFGDYGPYTDGKTSVISQLGWRIDYHCDDNRRLFCSFHNKKDSCRGMKTSVTLFLPNNTSNFYRSYRCRFGFPPSFGGAAKVGIKDEWHRKIISLNSRDKCNFRRGQ